MNQRRRPRGLLGAAVFVAFLFTLGAPSGAAAQRAGAARTGYELDLSARTTVEYGGVLRGSGTAYEVRGLAELRAVAGLRVVARIESWDSRSRSYRVEQETTVRADRDGRFGFELRVPERSMPRARLQVRVGSSASSGRSFEWGLSLQSPLAIDLLTDRVRYEPGESIRVWTRLSRKLSRHPEAGKTVRIRVTDAQGREIVDEDVSTSAAGVAAHSIELPDSARDGQYRIRAELRHPFLQASVGRAVTVGRRTVERILATATVDQVVAAPSEELTGSVSVNAPGGTPIRGAQLTVSVDGGGDPEVLTTDAQGRARFRIQAPAYMSGTLNHRRVDVRINHPAHGALHITAPFILSRSQWQLHARAANGGLVPEVDSIAYLMISDARGEPAPAGLELDVEGPAVKRRRARLTTDAHGLVAVPMHVAPGQEGPVSGGGAGCGGGQVATRFEVTIGGERPQTARVCVPVSRHAEVLPTVSSPLLTPGAPIRVRVQRRPAVRNRPVLLEAIARGRVVASTWLAGRSTEGSLEVAAAVTGVVVVRARPALDPGVDHALTEPGGAALGTGAHDAVLIRPADAFSLSVASGQALYRVQETAQLRLTTDRAVEGSYAALVVRDLTMHGGEQPWELRWIDEAIDEAITQPDAETAGLLLRSALSARLGADTRPRRPPPLVRHPWDQGTNSPYGASNAAGRGQLRDPVALRDEKLRRGIGQTMRALEAAVSRMGADSRSRQGIVTGQGARQGFDRDVVQTLVEGRHLNGAAAQTLGAEALTVAMLEAADSSFDFHTVARRVARKRLLKLMIALVRLTDPDSEDAARASATEPPERWLARLAQLEVVTTADLMDPWGKPFVFRRAGSGGPRWVLSSRAPDWELVSSGPDGRVGTRDDVRDPLARVVSENTPYSVASGEDALMNGIALLSPGQRTLNAMAEAYRSMSLASLDEERSGPVSASVSEQSADFDGLGLSGTGRGGGGMGEGTIGLGNMGTIGHGGGGGSGSGYGRGSGSLRSRSARAPRVRAGMAAAEEAAPMEMAIAGRPSPQFGTGTPFGAMAERIRERFPATLHFVAEVALDGTQTAIPVPLADALTTYRVEAIAWTASGWTTSALTEFRVDQEATVDAPVPPFATAGDTLRVPARVQNRTEEPLEVRVEIAAEGVELTAPEPVTLTVPPRDASEVVISIALPNAGEGALVIRALRASDGAPLDAVRRPLKVWTDARTVRASRQMVIEGETTIEVEVPEDATARGPGELRIAPGTLMFGDLHDLAAPILHKAWVLALLGEEIDSEARARVANLLHVTDDDEEHEIGGSPTRVGFAISAAWKDDSIADGVLRRAIRRVSSVAEGDDQRGEVNARQLDHRVEALLALAPAVRAGGRAELRPDLMRLVQRLRRSVGSDAVRLTDAPAAWAMSAAALALTRGDADAERARELLRRVDRFTVRVGDRAFLEPAENVGIWTARISPTAIVALAYEGLGEPQNALPFVRSLAGLVEGVDRWGNTARLWAIAAGGLLSGGVGGEVEVWVDDVAVATTTEEDLSVAVLDTIGSPGSHRVRVRIAGSGPALVWLDLRYGRPWDAAPARTAPFTVEVDGELGARDTRAGLGLTITNRGARIAARPVLELDMPAGTELDQPTRERIAELTSAEATMEGRVLRVALRPLAPGGHIRLPLPLRWSVGGSLRGLGVVVRDESSPASETLRAVALIPSRSLEIADSGPEPEAAEPDASPPPPPIPEPLPRIEAMQPIAEVLR